MKNIAITVAAVLLGASAFGQGQLIFANRVVGVFEAPVSYVDAANPVTGATAWAQYYAGPVGGTLQAIGSPVNFRASGGFTAAVSETVVPGVPAGSPAEVVLRAWHSDLGVTTWEAADALGLGGVGESGVITVNTGGAGTPPSLPSNLDGLAGFSISQVVPEPSIAALGLLGAGLLLIRRKK